VADSKNYASFGWIVPNLGHLGLAFFTYTMSWKGPSYCVNFSGAVVALFEVNGQANARFRNRVTELLDKSLVPPRHLRNLTEVLVRPGQGSTAFLTDIGAQRR
jgi:hypothetical protein